MSDYNLPADLRCFSCSTLASGYSEGRARCGACGCSWDVDTDAADCWTDLLLREIARQRAQLARTCAACLGPVEVDERALGLEGVRHG